MLSGYKPAQGDLWPRAVRCEGLEVCEKTRRSVHYRAYRECSVSVQPREARNGDIFRRTLGGIEDRSAPYDPKFFLTTPRREGEKNIIAFIGNNGSKKNLFAMKIIICRM